MTNPTLERAARAAAEASGRVFNRPAAHAIQAILNDGEGE